jgi:hypothetical protein
VVVLTLLLGACGGSGGDGSGPADSLSGWYAYSTGPGYAESYTAELEQAGDRLWFAGEEFLPEGEGWSLYDPAPYSPNRRQLTLHVMGEGHLEGVLRVLEAGALVRSDPYRLLLAPPPAGRVTYTGVVGGDPVAGDDVRAHAIDGNPPGFYAFALNAFRSRALLQIEVVFGEDPPIDAKTYTLGASTLQGGIFITERGLATSTAGSLVVTYWDADRMAGTWYFDLDDGGSLAGIFDVPITVHQ